MNKEELLKNISSLLKKHEDYLNANPEFFYAIEDRLVKAIDYEDWEGEEEPEDEEESYGEGYGDDLFDRVPDEDEEEGLEDDGDDDEAARWLQENDQGSVGEDGGDSPDVDEAQADEGAEPAAGGEGEESPAAAVEEAPKKRSRYTEWKPKDKYEPHHEEAIKRHMEEGYSHREAERLAGAHDAPTDFYSALKHTVHPSEPSPKMLEQMKALSQDWLKAASRKGDLSAEAERNPQKHASGKAISAHEAVHGDFHEAYNQFLNSDDLKGLKGRERHKAIKEWKSKWNEENPDHKEKAASVAGVGKDFEQAKQARQKRREEGTQALLEAGMAHGGDDQGGYSEVAAGGVDEGMSSQHAAQMVGGEKGESGYQTNIQRDPSAVFAERNPDYIKHLKSKLSGKLDEGQQKRLAAVESFKNKGNK